MVEELIAQSERWIVGIIWWRLAGMGIVLLCAETANLHTVMVIEVIDEIAQEVVDHHGGVVIEHGQMELERGGSVIGTQGGRCSHRRTPACREGVRSDGAKTSR